MWNRSLNFDLHTTKSLFEAADLNAEVFSDWSRIGVLVEHPADRKTTMWISHMKWMDEVWIGGTFLSEADPVEYKRERCFVGRVASEATLRKLLKVAIPFFKKGAVKELRGIVVSHVSRLLSMPEFNAEHYRRLETLQTAHGWKVINEDEAAGKWSKCARIFGDPQRALRFPTPRIAWDIVPVFSMSQAEQDALHSEIVKAFIGCVAELGLRGDTLDVLDWEHPSYQLILSESFERLDPVIWPVSLIPHDYAHLFLGPKWDYGVIIDGRAWKMCVFGERWIDWFNRNEPPRLKAMRIT